MYLTPPQQKEHGKQVFEIYFWIFVKLCRDMTFPFALDIQAEDTLAVFQRIS